MGYIIKVIPNQVNKDNNFNTLLLYYKIKILQFQYLSILKYSSKYQDDFRNGDGLYFENETFDK